MSFLAKFRAQTQTQSNPLYFENLWRARFGYRNRQKKKTNETRCCMMEVKFWWVHFWFFISMWWVKYATNEKNKEWKNTHSKTRPQCGRDLRLCKFIKLSIRKLRLVICATFHFWGQKADEITLEHSILSHGWEVHWNAKYARCNVMECKSSVHRIHLIYRYIHIKYRICI